jgi:Zn-finger nucleic acid-binding protein
MLCPICNVDLSLSERNGIEIDYCPKCRGIWLDRGELDKIIARATDIEDTMGQSKSSSRGKTFDDDDYGNKYQGYNKSKRKSFLGDLFDF